MHPLMAAAGHRLVMPTYTGLGERAHLANPSIDHSPNVTTPGALMALLQQIAAQPKR